MLVQCKGSGRAAGVGFNSKRAQCPACGKQQGVASNGRIKKHMRQVSKVELRKL